MSSRSIGKLRIVGFVVVAFGPGVAGQHVMAAMLPPGVSVPLVGVDGGSGPGTVIHDALIPFEIHGVGGALLYKGTLQDRVVRSDASGTLSFEPRIRDTQGGLNGMIATVAPRNFATFLTDVEYSTTSLGTEGPDRARRSFDGSVVSFDFLDPPLYSGVESRFMFIKTEATAFGPGGVTVIRLQTGESVLLDTMQPIREFEPGCRPIKFEDLPLRATFPNGSLFTADGVLVSVNDFYFGPGGCVTPFTGGAAQVQDNGHACRSGHELAVNNVNVAFDYGVPLLGLIIYYGEYGGNVNLEINGHCHNVLNFADLPPMIGGVAVTVMDNGVPGQSCGRIVLDGPITSVSIGGQELWIDDIACKPNPCFDDMTWPEAEITAPSPLTCVCDPVEVRGTADDANFDEYVLEYHSTSGGGWNLIASSHVPVVNNVLGVWNAAGLPQGHYTLRLTVRDRCGHTETDVVTVWLGTEFDNLTVRAPNNGDVLGGTVCLDGTVWDNYCFDEYFVEYRPMLGMVWTPVDPMHPVYTTPVINDPFALWNTIVPGVPDGNYVLRVRANDDCGNLATATRQVVVDNTAPVAVIDDPVSCSYVDGVVKIHGTATDAHLSSWVVQYTGGDAVGWVTIASGNSPVIDGVLGQWDTRALRPCAYTIRLLVSDSAVVDCNAAIHHHSEYHVSVNIGSCGDFDTDDDGDVDLFDYFGFLEAFTGPMVP